MNPSSWYNYYGDEQPSPLPPPSTLAEYSYDSRDWYEGAGYFTQTHGAGVCNAYVSPQSKTGYFCVDSPLDPSGFRIAINSPDTFEKNYADSLVVYGANPDSLYESSDGGIVDGDYWANGLQWESSDGMFSYDYTSTLTTVSIPRPTNPGDYLELVNSNVPGCVNEMTSRCPHLYDSIRGSLEYAQAGAEAQFCSNLTEISCHGLCLNNTEPNDYTRWLGNTCFASSEAYDKFSSWADYNSTAVAAYENLFPWSWRLESAGQTANIVNPLGPSLADCPSVTEKLLSFAMINVIVLICTAILGRRDVIFRLSCERLGKKGSRSWPWMALLSIALNLGANLINAALTRSVPGFSKVPFSGLFLLWSSRPRMAWVAALLMNYQKDESIYFGFAVSTLLAEVVLQAIGSVYLGMMTPLKQILAQCSFMRQVWQSIMRQSMDSFCAITCNIPPMVKMRY